MDGRIFDADSESPPWRRVKTASLECEELWAKTDLATWRKIAY